MSAALYKYFLDNYPNVNEKWTKVLSDLHWLAFRLLPPTGEPEFTPAGAATAKLGRNKKFNVLILIFLKPFGRRESKWNIYNYSQKYLLFFARMCFTMAGFFPSWSTFCQNQHLESGPLPPHFLYVDSLLFKCIC